MSHGKQSLYDKEIEVQVKYIIIAIHVTITTTFGDYGSEVVLMRARLNIRTAHTYSYKIARKYLR